MRLLTALVLTALFASPSFAGPMTDGERQRLVAHFEMTDAWIDSEVTGLSDTQVKFKMTPTSWSVEEVVMHLAIAEPQYWVLMISSHSQRHNLQIREVKAHANFPKR